MIDPHNNSASWLVQATADLIRMASQKGHEMDSCVFGNLKYTIHL